MLPGKKARKCQFAIVQPGFWCRTITITFDINRYFPPSRVAVFVYVRGAVWKRARSNFSDSPRHLEVKVAELQLKKVIFLNLNRKSGRKKKHITGRFGTRRGLAVFHNHTKKNSFTRFPRFSNNVRTKLLAHPIKSLKGILGAPTSLKIMMVQWKRGCHQEKTQQVLSLA